MLLCRILIATVGVATIVGMEPNRPAGVKSSPDAKGVRTMNPKQDSRSFEMQLEINAPVEAVWKALTDAHELTQWFPLNAKVKPGAGGNIWSSWGPPFEGDSRIEIWEPNKRLKTGWPTWGAKNDEARARLTVDYHLEGRGGKTILRLVHSGFGKDASWDKEYDGVSRGWSFELRGLRHYLENHRGEKRRVIWSKKVTDRPIESAMTRVIGPSGLVLRGKIDGLKEGDRYRLDVVGTKRHIEGIVAANIPPRHFSGSATNFNNAFFRCELEACGPDGKEEIWVWLSTYGLPAEDCDKLESDLRSSLDRALAGG